MKKRSMLLIIFSVLFLMTNLVCEENELQFEEIAKYVVHTTAQGLAGVLATIENEEEKIEFLRNYITPIRFYPDQTGYFYIYNYECVNIAHATQKDLEGENLFDYQDAKGKYVIRELSEVSKDGGGFVEFYWQKPNDEVEYKKMGYVEPIPGTDYFIGSGVYIQ